MEEKIEKLMEKTEKGDAEEGSVEEEGRKSGSKTGVLAQLTQYFLPFCWETWRRKWGGGGVNWVRGRSALWLCGRHGVTGGRREKKEHD